MFAVIWGPGNHHLSRSIRFRQRDRWRGHLCVVRLFNLHLRIGRWICKGVTIVILLLHSTRLDLLWVVRSSNFHQLRLCNTGVGEGGLPRAPCHHVLALLGVWHAAVQGLPHACPRAPPDAHTDAVLTFLLHNHEPERFKPVGIPIDCSVLFLSDLRDFSDFGCNFRRIPKLYYS